MTIEKADVVDFLKSIDSKSIDLVIADPPYGIEKDYGVEKSWATIEEWAIWCESWLAECSRILKDDGNLFVYGIHNFLCYNHVTLFKLGMIYRRQFIWHYENGFCGSRSLPRATYEPLIWFSHKKKSHFTEIREPYKSDDRLKYKIVKNGRVWKPNPLGRIVGDVWNIPTLAGRRFRDEKVEHPSQKPLAISERLVSHFSPAGGQVVVPFVGSGSECVAAFRLGRRFAGTEINSKYRAIARSRLIAEGWTPRAEPSLDFEMF